MARLSKLTLAFAAIAMTSGAFADQTINLATGLDASGNLQTAGDLLDANWTITGGNTQRGSAGQAWTVAPGNSDWYGGWLANGANSSWIAQDPDNSNNGLLDATTTFSLTANQVAGASFSNTFFTLDDEGEVLLNGHVEATLGNGNWGAMQAVTLNTADLIAGVNMLEVKVTGSDDFLEGVRFEGDLTTPNGTPEPFTLALGAAGIGIAVRRKLRTRK